MISEAIQKFKESVSPEKTRVESLSSHILVFGGNAPLNDKYASCRSVFLTWAHDSDYELAKFLITPENYPEWNQFKGYDNLVDFECDAGCLSRGILLFSECEGALAELGAFCMDEILCERLLVVVEGKHYESTSFIRLGPIKRIEDIYSSGSVCVVDSTSDKNIFEKDVEGVGAALKAKVNTLPKTTKFDPKRTRDQFLLIADLIELFGVLTQGEVEDLLSFMEVSHEPGRLKQMLRLLKLFELVVETRPLTEHFLVPPKERKLFLTYSAPMGSKFERSPFKLKTAQPALLKESVRLKAYAKIHGEPKWI